MKLIFATRPSRLARWQTQSVLSHIQRTNPSIICEEKIITTQGDKILDKPLPEIGGKGLFTQELERELLTGTVHCAVHSLKDLPVENPTGLVLGCIPARADVRDVLISARGFTLSSMPEGSLVGTSSLRRAAQVLAVRPDVQIIPLRGNIETRLRKVLEGKYDAIILAGAGLYRLGLESQVTEWLSLDVMLPAPGQGALAVQCRADDNLTLSLLASLDDQATREAISAERQFLHSLGGGCSLPVAAFAWYSGKLNLKGLVASPDGKMMIKVSGEGVSAKDLGQHLANEALAKGANTLLDMASHPC